MAGCHPPVGNARETVPHLWMGSARATSLLAWRLRGAVMAAGSEAAGVWCGGFVDW